MVRTLGGRDGMDPALRDAQAGGLLCERDNIRVVVQNGRIVHRRA